MSVDALFAAVAAGDAARVSALTAADPALARSKDVNSLSVLQFARYMGQTEILASLIDAGPPLDVFEAAQIDAAGRVRELLDAQSDLVSAYSADGFTALHFAAYYGATGAMRLLLDRGASTSAVTQNFLANMPLHAAVAGRRPATYEACEILLKARADVNARQHGGFTPIQAPAQHGDRALAELLLSHGADPGMANDEGKTAADIAAAQGNVELAALLRVRAAD